MLTLSVSILFEVRDKEDWSLRIKIRTVAASQVEDDRTQQRGTRELPGAVSGTGEVVTWVYACVRICPAYLRLL